MNKLHLAIASLFLVATFGHEGLAAQPVEDSAKALKINAVVKSNRTNIYEGDIEDLVLKKGKIAAPLIGSSEDFSGAVVIEIEQCRNGQVFQLSKQKKSAGGANSGASTVVQTDSCQQGLSTLVYDLSTEDICKSGESVELSLKDSTSKKVKVLGSVFPRISISNWETYLFVDEQFKYNPSQLNQEYVGVSDVFLTLSTAFSRFLNGKSGTVDFAINKNGLVSKYHQEFILEDGSHSLDISQHEYGVNVGDTVTAKYSIGGFEYTQDFKVVKDFTQKVALKGTKLVYSLELNSVDWFIADALSSVFKEADYSRGGRYIDIFHQVTTPLGGRTYGNYELHMTLNGYQHLYLNTSVVQ